jgi:flagellar hook assembly protein FlgD
MELQDNVLSQPQIDYILHTLDGAGQSNGILYLTGNAAPSAEGLVHYDNLKVRGWTITITKLPVTGITVSGAGGATTITADNRTLQLSAEVLPANATDKTVTWSIVNGTGEAMINSTGLVTSINNGTVTAKATANDGSEVYCTLGIDIKTVEPIIVALNRYEMIVKVPDNYLSAKISIFNINGYLVETKTLNSNNCIFNISHLPPGIYFLSIHKSMILDAVKVIKPW